MSKNKSKTVVYRPIITEPVIVGPKAEPQISAETVIVGPKAEPQISTETLLNTYKIKAEPQISTILKKERNISSGYFPEVVTGTFNSDYVYKYLTINEKILTIDGKGLTINKN
jgi:hypothetical protein